MQSRRFSSLVSCLNMKMASVLPLPDMKPNCMLSLDSCSRIIVLRICSRTFPQAKASPFSLKRLMIYDKCHWYSAFVHYVIEEWGCTINNSTVSSRNNRYDNTWGCSSFTNLHFVDRFRHHLSSNLNPFWSNVTFLYPLRTSENHRFSDFFRRYRNVILD